MAFCGKGSAAAAVLLLVAALHAEHLPVKLYTTAEGLARNRIDAIMADSRGFIWIATAEGISLFDGYRFVNYGTRNGLPSPVVNAILEARDGTFWVGTDGGLSVLHPKGGPHMFTLHHQPAPEFLHAVNTLVQDNTGAIWAGTDDGLYRETNPATRSQTPEWIRLDQPHNGQPQEVRSLLVDRQGSLWIGAARGLYRRYPNGRIEAYSTGNGLPATFVEKVLQDTEGRIWAGTREGLCRIVADPHPGEKVVERVYTEADGLGYRDIKALSLAPDGTIWVGCLSGGLSHLRMGTDGRAHIRTYSKTEGLSDASIDALAHDRQGNLWVGGESAGLMRIVRSGFLTYTQADGLANDRVAQIFEDRAGNLCVSANNLAVHRAEISCFDGERFQPRRYPKGYDWPLSPILQDHSGMWWLGASGLVRVGRIPIEQLAQHLPEKVFGARGVVNDYTIFEDSQGGIWVSLKGDSNRVGKWDEAGGFRVLPSTNGPVEQLVSAFAEDHSGNVWMGLYGDGVVRYRDGKFRKFGVADGVPKGYISSLYVDDAGRLWIGSYDGGLGRIDSPGADRPQVLIYDASHGLTSDHITSLTSDRWSRIYAGTGRGVDRLDPASGQAIHYTIADGLANDTPLTSWRDRRGWLWFCTTKGISRLVPEPDTPTAPPPIRITALTAGAAPYTVSELGASALSGLEFASGDLQIAFSSINFEAGESMRYQYRLEGGGGQWTAPSDQRSVNLAGLSPGGYRFEVRAVNSRGQVSEQPAAVSFSIPPPLYARQWFRLLCVVAVSLLLYGLYRFRLDRILELEHIRMRIATDLHDDIGSSLSQIAILSEVARRPGEAGAAELDPLGSIARISRELVDSMSDIVWAVNPKRDNLLDLARRMRQFAGEMLVPGGIDFTFDAAAASSHVALGADLRRQVFLIFKECINNVARHSGATQVDIVFTVSGGMLRITVRDNGRGFDPRDLLTSGHGLASMTNRAAALRGKLRIQPECGVGTTASLEIPLARHRVW